MIEKQGIVQFTQYTYTVFYRTQEDDHYPLEKTSDSIANGQTSPYRPAV
jgi:hypothetical protein